ncbi:MAG: hypothetical protein ACYCSS_14795 [Sulfuriferula sp.]
MLTGNPAYRNCADGITPCQFLGYEFKNGKVLYFLDQIRGSLQVKLGEKLLLEEKGEWHDATP